MVLSKKEIALYFNLVTSSGMIKYKSLREHFFTETVLSQIGMTGEEYNKARIFTYQQTKEIIKIFEIEQKDIHEDIKK